MKTLCNIALLVLAVSVLAPPDPAWSLEPGRLGLRAGLGTDITGGIAFGLGGNYLIPQGTSGLELGVMLFGGKFEETSDNGFNLYEETTDVFVFAMTANYLAGYRTDQPGPFFVAGVGLGSFAVSWEERSATDTSLGTPLPGGGSMQAEDGSVGGSVLNLGVGHTFRNGFDARFEIPVFVTFSAPGDASSVVPTFVVTAGKRF